MKFTIGSPFDEISHDEFQRRLEKIFGFKFQRHSMNIASYPITCDACGVKLPNRKYIDYHIKFPCIGK